jgi:diguanylate cyclase (GGDEF)-like protein
MRYLHLKLAGPAIAGVALLIGGLATISYFGAARIDNEARTQQETLVQRNIALWIEDIEFSLTSWTVWDEAIAKLDATFDKEWADRNIGASLIGTSRTRFTAVLKPDGAILYNFVAPSVANRPFFRRGTEAIVADAAPLVADVRARERLPRKSGIPDPLCLSRIEVIGKDAVLLSASLFQPDFGTVKPKGDRAPILITAMPIDASLETFFGTRFLLDDAHVGSLTAVAPDRARAGIAIGADGEVQVLSWRPPTPAADILRQATPLILTVGLVLVLGGVLVVRISQSTARMLVVRERQMAHAATHDFLTGLSNRARLEGTFSAEVKQGPLVVVCLDLDGFKGVNDTHGHAIGDDLLRVVAARLRSGTRETDCLFRLGGDEFAILMPDITLADAERACHRLAEALSAPMYLPGHRLEIAACFGLGAADLDTTCDDAFKAADDALYRAKALGSGSVVVSASLSNPSAASATPPATAPAAPGGAGGTGTR